MSAPVEFQLRVEDEPAGMDSGSAVIVKVTGARSISTLFITQTSVVLAYHPWNLLHLKTLLCLQCFLNV